jgi:8-oxo-dGTP pyrophosphatase MutT (NUDIX family)
MDRYEILCRRRGGTVELHHHPDDVLDLALKRQQIDARCEALRRAGRKLESNPLYRLLSWRETPEGLVLETGAVDYLDYLGLDGPAVVVTIAGACEVDGQLVLEKRGQRVAVGPGMLHVKPSGHVHPPQSCWDALLMETEEELGIRPDELRGAEFLGMVRSLTAPCIVLVYRFNVEGSWGKLLQRKAVDAWEYEHLLGLPVDRLEEWLLTHYDRVTGPGHATILLEGWARHGEAWYQRVLARLRDLH